MGTGKEIKRELSARAVPFGFFTFSDQHIVNGEVFNYEKFTATARLYLKSACRFKMSSSKQRIEILVCFFGQFSYNPNFLGLFSGLMADFFMLIDKVLPGEFYSR